MTKFDPLFDISGKTAIVTGASSGLGMTFAKFLAQRGSNVVISARRIEKIEELSSQLNQQGFSSIAVPCDVTESSQVNDMFDAAENNFDRVDIIVNNAGQIAEAGTVPEKITDEMFD